jgi:hypothetical protein
MLPGQLPTATRRPLPIPIGLSDSDFSTLVPALIIDL